jgi:hypothetical protein
MEALKLNINVFLDELTGEQSPLRDWRGKVVTYRDEKVDGSNWFEDNPFVQNDNASLKAQLGTLRAGGGGDDPESLLDALHIVSSIGQSEKGAQEIDPYMWRYRSDAARVVIVFTDATYHPTMSYSDGSGGTVDDVVNKLMAEKIILILYAPDEASYDDLQAVDKCVWEPIPSVSGSYAIGLEEYTKDRTNFQNALINLAKSVSTSVPAPEL